MSYIDYHNLATADGDLRVRVKVAVHKAAVDIRNESDQTANHANRLAWANAAFVDPEAKAAEMLWSVVANTDVYAAHAPGSQSDAGWRDLKVQEAVNGLIDTFATGS